MYQTQFYLELSEVPSLHLKIQNLSQTDTQETAPVSMLFP